jgi:hypothetical protein
LLQYLLSSCFSCNGSEIFVHWGSVFSSSSLVIFRGCTFWQCWRQIAL